MKKLQLVSLILILLVFSCSRKLSNPLKGSISSSRTTDTSALHMNGTAVYLYPTNNFRVRSLEKSTVASIVRFPDSSYNIIAIGEHAIGYGNLKECFVSKGSLIQKNQIIGT